MRIVVRRLLGAISIILPITVLAFVMVELIPSNVAHVLAGDDASPDYVRRIGRGS
jgi:ABC-type dipeptide/oligopeptide/nickel transport system permease component